MRAGGRFTLHVVVSRPSPSWLGASGRVTASLLELLLQEPRDPAAALRQEGMDGMRVIVAGPDAMRVNAIGCLLEVGYDNTAIVELTNEEISMSELS